MKLHYSQTKASHVTPTSQVLLPYEITLLSNGEVNLGDIGTVLLPYEITLLSNKCLVG